MSLMIEILRGVAETIRETLPSDEREAGAFVAGMAWAFLLFIACLLVTSWLAVTAMGGHP